MCDFSFSADKSSEGAFEPVTNIGKVHQLLYEFMNDNLLCNARDTDEFADNLMDVLKPYIKDN